MFEKSVAGIVNSSGTTKQVTTSQFLDRFRYFRALSVPGGTYIA